VRQNTNYFIRNVCRELHNCPESAPARLIIENREVATGSVVLDDGKPEVFRPADGRNLDHCPAQEIIPEIPNASSMLRLKHLRRCPVGSTHYHFEIDRIIQRTP
jgi:hypothetical protein